MKVLIPICPICQKLNVPPAHITGHACKGTPKTPSAASLAQRKAASKMPRGLKTFWIHTATGLKITVRERSLDCACKKYSLKLSDVKWYCVVDKAPRGGRLCVGGSPKT